MLGCPVLTIRRAQLHHFEGDAELRFVDQLVEIVAGAWPCLAQALGPTGLRPHVERALGDARAHGFSEPQHLVKYVNVGCALGLGFATRQRFAWAARILAERNAPVDRIDRLVAATTRYLESR